VFVSRAGMSLQKKCRALSVFVSRAGMSLQKKAVRELSVFVSRSGMSLQKKAVRELSVFVSRAGMSLQKKAVRELRLMFDTTAYFDSEQITSILMVCLHCLVQCLFVYKNYGTLILPCLLF